MENVTDFAAPIGKTKPKGVSLKTLARRTARLWRSAGLDYDQIRAVSADARKLLMVTRPTKRRTAPERLSTDEARRFIEFAYRAGGSRGLMLKTLLETGSRVSEFCNLKIEDFHPEEKTIQIVHGKGDKSRAVPLTMALAQELRTHIGDRRSGPLFKNRSRAAFGARRVQQIVQEIATSAGIDRPVHPHLLRHSVAQGLLDAGMPLEHLQQFLGHSQITTTQIYAEATPVAIRESFGAAMLAVAGSR